MSALLRRRPSVDHEAWQALLAAVADPKFELIPLKNAMAQAELLPAGALVSVTASPAKGIEATVDLSARLALQGFRVVPHLSAHMIRDRAHLAGLVDRLADAGVERTFVVGGDGDEASEFPDGVALLRAIADLAHPFKEIGIGCYPQGHPSIRTPDLDAALAAKQPLAHYMTTQLCFDPKAIQAWLAGRRSAGITLPVQVGVPGVAELRKLMAISARIGVADSRRFLMKNTRLVGRLLMRPGGYRPDGLLEGLAPLFCDPVADVRGIHLYTFNQVETTETWRKEFLAERARG